MSEPLPLLAAVQLPPSRSWVASERHPGTGRACAWACESHPGWEVRHCGHPTANRPYFVERDGEPVLIPVGETGINTFRTLAEAQAFATGRALAAKRHAAQLAAIQGIAAIPVTRREG